MAPCKNKWFRGIRVSIPDIVYASIKLTDEDIEQFFQEVSRIGLSERSINTFKTLAEMAPEVRLSANLKGLLSVYASKGSVTNILSDGLREREYLAVYDLTLRRADPRTHMIAHSLLNIYERQSVQKMLEPIYTAYRLPRNHKKELEGEDNA